MISLFTVTVFGFILGMRHATDADHVIAVTTIVSRFPDVRRAARTGLYWGIGHSMTILLVGSSVILLGLVIPARVELGLELAVCAMLVLLGLAGLASFFKPDSTGSKNFGSVGSEIIRASRSLFGFAEASAAPAQRMEAHVHPHVKGRTPLALSIFDRVLGPFRLFQHVRPLVVGIVHGMAGSAAVALLILTAIPHPGWGIAYLIFFGVGTIAGMMLITIGIAAASVFLERKCSGSFRWFRLSAGLLSLAFGVFLGYQLLFLEEPFLWISH